ncbi:hypothetical protein GCM10022226_10800 [Sphaerisporangium flaviroseum]|uniref:Transmembrane protein n=1 Tax=Sphaerisporangium flaviroseum TaxID=509199 RepID=A0ABP7HI85_9ACTN
MPSRRAVLSWTEGFCVGCGVVRWLVGVGGVGGWTEAICAGWGLVLWLVGVGGWLECLINLFGPPGTRLIGVPG